MSEEDLVRARNTRTGEARKIDEWSVGCIFMEMVLGSPPFRGRPECTCQCPQVMLRNEFY